MYGQIVRPADSEPELAHLITRVIVNDDFVWQILRALVHFVQKPAPQGRAPVHVTTEAAMTTPPPGSASDEGESGGSSEVKLSPPTASCTARQSA
jgi:hypothetical protein